MNMVNNNKKFAARLLVFETSTISHYDRRTNGVSLLESSILTHTST